MVSIVPRRGHGVSRRRARLRRPPGVLIRYSLRRDARQGETAGETPAQLPRHPGRRPAPRRVRRGRPPLHADAPRGPDRPRGRAVRAGVPHHAHLLPQSRVHPHRSVREPPRHHRQRGARRGQPSPAQLSSGAAAAGLRHRPHRQVAHGQRRPAPPRLRPLGGLRWARAHRRSAPLPQRRLRRAHRLHHRHPQPPRGGVREQGPPPAVVALPRAQGGAPRRRSSLRRHARDRGGGRLSRGRSAPRPLPRRRLPPQAEHARPRSGGEGQARLDGGLRAAGHRTARARCSIACTPASRRRSACGPA